MVQTSGFYDFGAFRFDIQNRLLWRVEDNEAIPLTIKEAEVLHFLLENAGVVVKKDDLLDAIWKDTFVEEGTLTRNISRLRKKLESADEDEKIIETLPKRGYRFLPTIVKVNPGALFVEEHTQMRVRVEETVSVPEGVGEWRSRGVEENKIAALPGGSASPPLPHSPTPRLLIAFGIIALAIAGFLVYQYYFRQPETRAVVASGIRPFSGATGRENTPAFSPDGKQLAFVWDGGEGGSGDVYIRLIGAVEPVRLTDTASDERYPTFSPDGSHIAFVRAFPSHGEVILIPALGGAERRVARLFSGFASISFAPDGQTIAVIDTEDSTENKQYRVYLVDLQTGERRRLTPPAEFVGETTPRFSPDGKSLAFVRVFDDKNQDLFIVPTTGGSPRQITFDKAVIHSLAWSADGQKIFFVSNRDGSQPNVWRVAAVDGEKPQLIATPGRDISNLALSPDGKTIAFVENLRNTDIWSSTADAQTAKRFAPSIYSEHDPHFSPDGSRVVFTSNRTGKYDIWLADADGRNLRALTDAADYVGSPRFSPDGSQIVYRGNADGNSEIFVASVEGGAIRRLTQNAERDLAPAWSADGAWIYFMSNRTGENQIWKTPADGKGESLQITRQGGFGAQAAPDGKVIFYTKSVSPANEKERTELWRVPADGGAEQPVPGFADDNFPGIWAMTRTGIYFLARESDEFFTIRFYDFADGKIKDAAGDIKIPNKVYGNFAAGPDGTRFLYALLDQNASSIMLAEID